MAAVQAGVGRETAHEAIKEHAVAVALNMREGGATNDLVDRLSTDPRLATVPPDTWVHLLADPMSFAGAATSQVGRVVERISAIVAAHPQAAAYAPASIL